mgnify:FL=1
MNREPVYLGIEYIFPRLKRHPTSPLSLPPPPHTSKPDGSKLQRAVEDALTDAGVWGDDAQVCKWHGVKRYALVGESPGVQITIESA